MEVLHRLIVLSDSALVCLAGASRLLDALRLRISLHDWCTAILNRLSCLMLLRQNANPVLVVLLNLLQLLDLHHDMLDAWLNLLYLLHVLFLLGFFALCYCVVVHSLVLFYLQANLLQPLLQLVQLLSRC